MVLGKKKKELNSAQSAIKDSTFAGRLGFPRGFPKKYASSFIRAVKGKEKEKEYKEGVSHILEARTVGDLNAFVPKISPDRVSKVTRLGNNQVISKLPKNQRMNLFLFYRSSGVPKEVLKILEKKLNL